MGSTSEWTYFEAELKRQLGKKIADTWDAAFEHSLASSCNMYAKTFTGIDGAGKRLADEVMEVVQRQRAYGRYCFWPIHLVDYAVSVLYTPKVSSDQFDNVASSTATSLNTSCSPTKGLIAGLEAINFATLATPHLGVRGNKQGLESDLQTVNFLKYLAPLPSGRIFLGETRCTNGPYFC